MSSYSSSAPSLSQDVGVAKVTTLKIGLLDSEQEAR